MPRTDPHEPHLTRRQLIAAGTTAIAAIAVGGSGRQFGGSWPAGGDASAIAAAAGVEIGARFVSRPDLRIPGLTVSLATRAVAPGLILLAPYNAPAAAQRGVLIVDNAGSPVWQQPLADLTAANLRVQTFRGAPALTWWQGDIDLGHGIGSYVVANSSYAKIAHANAGNGYHGDLHEFLLTDQGTALLTTYVVAHRDLRAVGGPADGTIQDAIVQEIDLATGRVLFEWHSLDHIPIGESYWGVGANWDYVHLNSIAIDTDHNLLLSSRNTHSVYKVDRSTGAIIWRLGGKSSDFAIAPDAAFAWQHDARRQPNGTISLFDNGVTASRALILNVDEVHRRVTLARAYTHPNKLLAASQGNVQVLPNGNVFVGWGAQPFVSEFTAAGDLVFDAQIANGVITPQGAGYISYRAYRATWPGEGIGSPAVVARRAGPHTEIYVSWNGDTRVRRWTALSSTGGRGLTAVDAVSRRGFETGLRVPAAVTHLRISGSDRAGRTVTTTPLIRI